MPTNPQSLADAFFGTPGQHDLVRYGRALFPDQDEQRIGQAVEQERSSGKDDHSILGQGVELAKQRLPREWAGRAQQIQQQYQDEVQRQQALSAERTRASSKWKILAGLGQALAGRDPSAIASHFDQLEQLNLQGGLRQAEQNREAGLQGLQLEQQGAQADRQAVQDQQQATLFQQGQEDRTRQQAQLAAEDDPDSEESRIAQELARRIMNRPAPGLTASKFKQTWPQLEKVYQIEQQRLNRQDSLNAQNAAREDAQKDREAGRAQALTDRKNERLETEERKIGEKKQEQARAVEEFSSNINDQIDYLKGLIDQYGTQEVLGPAEQNMRSAVLSIATDLAKLRDPQSAARETEVARESSTLFEPGFFQSAETAKSRLDALKSQVEKRKANAYRIRGLSGPETAPGANPGRITVTNGQETLEIDAADLQDAEAEGYRRAP